LDFELGLDFEAGVELQDFELKLELALTATLWSSELIVHASWWPAPLGVWSRHLMDWI
jgi:hypothetical protein